LSELLCVTCPVLRAKSQPRRPNRPLVCDGCRKRLAADLAAIIPAYADLDPAPVRGMSEILTRVFESKPPLNLNELSPRLSGYETPRAILSTLCRIVAEDFALDLPYDSVSLMAEWLGLHLERLCDEHPAVDDFARDIRQIAGELHVYERAADRTGERVGRCPRTRYDDGDPCNTPLACDPYISRITCPRCGASWDRDAGGWVKLRAAQLEREDQWQSSGVEATAA